MVEETVKCEIEYQIVYDDAEHITESVNGLLSTGWTLQGSPFVYNSKICQAVIRTVPSKKKTEHRLL